MGRASRLRPEHLADKLLQIRNGLGLSQNELIRHLGLTDVLYQSNVSGFEVGEREPALPILLKYARAAGVSTDVLIDDEIDLPDPLPAISQPKIKKHEAGTPEKHSQSKAAKNK